MCLRVEKTLSFDFWKKIKLFHFFMFISLPNLSSCNDNKFPDNFVLGVGTSAFQSEGAWNVSNKGESIWDVLIHEKPDVVWGKANADVAANSYYLYKTDIDLVEKIGANAFKISISWPRILPNGFNNEINYDGIQHYHDVIDEILSRNITPYINMYHWDLPIRLQKLGGLANPLFVNWYLDYAEILFRTFGDKCHPWGLSAIIRRITTKYNTPAIVIGENGYRDEGQLDDIDRGQFFYYHLKEVLKLVREGFNIQGYFTWTLFDIFEWTQGYEHRYGLFSVNFTDPERPRVPKLWSAKVITDIYRTRLIPPSFESFSQR
ncbi:GSCOCG00005279001-RA-CDS [Cotesia congregata]|uniref:Similar to Myrosinase 1 (Brevicoryne brassicae) n=1 Tax=Cotesia congregata TaxID=51543 RepID=A0A8J2H9F3_COTCN|nr:GSCOCG00005279001-RA-CDS [Cotesia congregata]CAG5083965.1 Similar to Myrosinase 1 (Brevicoryne brassicae) [Cotesia congregata]